MFPPTILISITPLILECSLADGTGSFLDSGVLLPGVLEKLLADPRGKREKKTNLESPEVGGGKCPTLTLKIFHVKTEKLPLCI